MAAPRFADLRDPWEPTEPFVGCGVVVVDLFRATSTLQVIVDRGCVARLLTRVPDSVERAPGARYRIGEWRGERPPGGDCGNSPIEVADLDLEDAEVEFISSNGAGAIVAAAEAECVWCASLFNEEAVVSAVADSTIARWWLVPAGCRGARRIEDDYVCGRIGSSLRERGFELGPRLAESARAAASTSDDDLLRSPGATFVIEREGPADIEFILGGTYESRTVPALVDGRVVAATTTG
jgi:phosphosulfolactate phosphohydrolase-like enzyme